MLLALGIGRNRLAAAWFGLVPDQVRDGQFVWLGLVCPLHGDLDPLAAVEGFRLAPQLVHAMSPAS